MNVKNSSGGPFFIPGFLSFTVDDLTGSSKLILELLSEQQVRKLKSAQEKLIPHKQD